VIHRAAAEGFARSADAYERGRPGYPAEAIDVLVSRLPANARVLDLAAGTGALARPLHDAGFNVTAVEPVAEMRAALPESIRALEGTAEAIPLGDGEVDAVVVGQAFHWFDGGAALAEIHRVLRPEGMLALFWNVRLREHPLHAAIDELIDPYRGETPSHRWGAWRETFDRTSLFQLHRGARPADPRDGARARASARRRRNRHPALPDRGAALALDMSTCGFGERTRDCLV
jgi:SAM-dependent methyltransferase